MEKDVSLKAELKGSFVHGHGPRESSFEAFELSADLTLQPGRGLGLGPRSFLLFPASDMRLKRRRAPGGLWPSGLGKVLATRLQPTRRGTWSPALLQVAAGASGRTPSSCRAPVAACRWPWRERLRLP